MDVEIEEIKQFLGEFSLSAKDDALNKMKELCFVYHCGAEDIVDHWVAFSTSKKNCQSPTIPLLDQMENEVLIKMKMKSRKSINSVTTPVYNASTIDLLCNTSAKHTSKDSRNASHISDKSPHFSPSSMTPSCFTPSQKYSSRTGIGNSVCSFGDVGAVEWKHSDEFSCNVTAYNPKTTIKASYPYMSEKSGDIASILNDMIQEAAEKISKENNIEDWGHIHLPSVEPVPVIGRICSDGSGRLSSTSLFLEGSQELASGQTVPLDASRLPKFSFFPGQIIAGTGVNNLGRKLTMQSLFEDTFPQFEPKVPDLANCFDSLGVVIAAGPFATSDTLSYEPLWDLMKYVKEYMPQVVILIGPFVDCKNKLIESGSLNEAYEDVFRTVISEILNHIENLSTKVVLVPSTRDVHLENIYPTPPYSVQHPTKRLYLASDPCLLNIEGVIFAISSTDILFHLGREEVSHPQQPDRLGRLCYHILAQKNFYPLNPPNEDVNIDFLRYETNAGLPVMPHVLVLPSDFKHFIKDVNGCCCINPERLTKYSSGGTFARLKIKRIDESTYKGSILDCIQAQIIKI